MTQTIGELVNALREKCREDLGAEVHIDISAHRMPNHDAAELAAIRMAMELVGGMSGAHRPEKPEHPLRWFRVMGEKCDFTAFWEEKEKLPGQAAVS